MTIYCNGQPVPVEWRLLIPYCSRCGQRVKVVW